LLDALIAAGLTVESTAGGEADDATDLNSAQEDWPF